jgi:hypothetical protein
VAAIRRLAALLQVGLGWLLWQGAAAGREGAWALVLAPIALRSCWRVLLRPCACWRLACAAGTGRTGAAWRMGHGAAATAISRCSTPRTPLPGTLQDALAVLLVAWAGDGGMGLWGWRCAI